MRGKIGLKEIAEKAGVSVMTVSFALNNRGHVSEAKRREICTLAKRMGYVPNAAGRILKSSSVPDIGLVLFEKEGMILKNAGAQDAVIRFMAECRKQRRRFQTEWFDPEQHPDSLPDLFTNGLVGGILIYGIPSPAAKKILEKQAVPAVILDHPGQYSVRFERKKAMRQAIGFLKEKGCSRIGFINGPKKINCFQQYELAFRNAMEALGLPIHEKLVYTRTAASPYQAGAEMLAERFLKNPAGIPDGLLISGDSYVNGFLYHLQKNGISLPENLTVVCFELLGWQAEAFAYPLSSVEYDMQPLIRQGIELLGRLMNGEKIRDPRRSVETAFVMRGI